VKKQSSSLPYGVKVLCHETHREHVKNVSPSHGLHWGNKAGDFAFKPMSTGATPTTLHDRDLSSQAVADLEPKEGREVPQMYCMAGGA